MTTLEVFRAAMRDKRAAAKGSAEWQVLYNTALTLLLIVWKVPARDWPQWEGMRK